MKAEMRKDCVDKLISGFKQAKRAYILMPMACFHRRRSRCSQAGPTVPETVSSVPPLGPLALELTALFPTCS